MLLGPGRETLFERPGLLQGASKVKPLQISGCNRENIRVAKVTAEAGSAPFFFILQLAMGCCVRLKGLEDDGDGAVGQFFRQLSFPGKGLGTKNLTLLCSPGEADAIVKAAGQKRAQRRSLAASASAKRGMAFIEQDGGGRLYFHALQGWRG